MKFRKTKALLVVQQKSLGKTISDDNDWIVKQVDDAK